jgi:hypothetical protein
MESVIWENIVSPMLGEHEVVNDSERLIP